VGQQLVALLRRRVKADGGVGLVLRAEGHGPARPVDGAGGGVDQVLHRVRPARLQQVVKADDIGLDIGVRMVDAVPYPRLGGQVDHHVKGIRPKQRLERLLVRKGALYEHVPHRGGGGRLADLLQPPLLQAHVVVIVHVVKGHNGGPRPLRAPGQE